MAPSSWDMKSPSWVAPLATNESRRLAAVVLAGAAMHRRKLFVESEHGAVVPGYVHVHVAVDETA